MPKATNLSRLDFLRDPLRSQFASRAGNQNINTFFNTSALGGVDEAEGEGGVGVSFFIHRLSTAL